MNEKKSRLEVNIKNFFLDLHFPERPQKLNQTPNILRDDNKICVQNRSKEGHLIYQVRSKPKTDL